MKLNKYKRYNKYPIYNQIHLKIINQIENQIDGYIFWKSNNKIYDLINLDWKDLYETK